VPRITGRTTSRRGLLLLLLVVLALTLTACPADEEVAEPAPEPEPEEAEPDEETPAPDDEVAALEPVGDLTVGTIGIPPIVAMIQPYVALEEGF
jgi:hypothetical protein